MGAHRDGCRRSRRIRSCAAAAALGLVGLAAVVAPVDAQPAQPTQPAQPAQAPSIPDGGRFLEPVFDEVQRTEDIPYRDTVDSEGNPITLHLDIYEPAGDTDEQRPVIAWMHGGGFVGGDKSSMAPYAEEFARRGYVTISVQYRLRPGVGDALGLLDAVLDAYDDSLAAVEWLRDNADEHRLDPGAIVAGGISAGAVNAFNLAYLPGHFDRPTPSNIAAAVSISGLTLGAAEPGDPPVIAFHGTEDTIVPFVNGQNSCEGAREAGLPFEFVIYEGAGHEIGGTQFSDIVERTTDFLADVVLAPLGYFGEPFDPGAPPEPDCGLELEAEEPPPAEAVVVPPTFTG